MPLTTYPIFSEGLRRIHLSDKDFWSCVGEESKTIRLLSNRFFTLGEKVEVYIDPLDGKNVRNLPLIRFVTNISEAVPLYLDDDSILIELSVYNNVEL